MIADTHLLVILKNLHMICQQLQIRIELDGTTNYIAILQFSIILIHQNTLYCSPTILMVHQSAPPCIFSISQSRNTNIEHNRAISIDIMSPMVKPSYLHLLMYQLIVVLCWVHLDSTTQTSNHNYITNPHLNSTYPKLQHILGILSSINSTHQNNIHNPI